MHVTNKRKFMVSAVMELGLLALLLAALPSLCSARLPLDVATPTGYTQLRKWGQSSLYRIEADSSNYEHAPLLIHLTGSRYGEYGESYSRTVCSSGLRTLLYSAVVSLTGVCMFAHQ